MVTKIVLLTVLFFLNLLGFLSLASTLLNIPFKMFFGLKNYRTGNKKLYWIGHVLLVLIIFFLWEELLKIPPSLSLVIILISSSTISILISKNSLLFKNGSFYISRTVKIAFIINLIILYTLGLLFKKIDFIFW